MIKRIAVMSVKRNGCTANQNSIRNCLLKPSCGSEYLLYGMARGLGIRTICVNGSIRRHMTRLSHLISRTPHDDEVRGTVIPSSLMSRSSVPLGPARLLALIGWRFRRRRSLIPGKS